MLKKLPQQVGTTVVYVEPDRTNALLMQCLLGARTDYTLHHASVGCSGLELCRRVNPDLVITEMRLPDMTGYDVLQALRNDRATETVPCIVLSGDAMPAHIERALASGFDDYWTKPMDVWHLLQRIRNAVGLSSRARHRHEGMAAAMVDRPLQYGPISRPIAMPLNL